MAKQGLSHLNAQGDVHMVDVSAKSATPRRALASGRISMSAEALAAIRNHTAEKGDVLAVARIAAIQAAKRTADWIPLAHPIPLTHVAVDIAIDEGGSAVVVQVETATIAATGVEMEALTAVTASLLTLYDMLKGVDRAMTIGPIALLEKSGGQSHFRRREEPGGNA